MYRGQAIPSLRGLYFYSDFCQGWIRSFRMANGRATEPKEWPELKPGGTVLSFGQDAAGELYILAGNGKIYRIAPAES